jgi:hypothetical protein
MLAIEEQYFEILVSPRCVPVGKIFSGLPSLFYELNVRHQHHLCVCFQAFEQMLLCRNSYITRVFRQTTEPFAKNVLDM